MKLYADLPGRRTMQILADLLMFCWVAVWAWLGRLVHDATLGLLGPAHGLQRAGTSFGSTMHSAATTLGQLPVIGDQLQAPFRRAEGAGSTIAGAGRDLGTAVTNLATVLGLLTAVVPIVVLLAVWLFFRIRFVRRATSAQRFIDADADLDLFALRAMARQPMHRIAAVSDDPVAAWRAGDRRVVDALALLELRDAGLHPPRLGARSQEQVLG